VHSHWAASAAMAFSFAALFFLFFLLSLFFFLIFDHHFEKFSF